MNLNFDWPRAHTFKLSSGQIKAEAADFKVTERLPETPAGEGEHLWLRISKEGQNTAWVARQIAKWAGVSQRDVSYAGLKDRNAVTEQTFSIHLPGKEDPDLASIQIEGVTLIEGLRHNRKLKTGHLIGNRFVIRVRNTDISIVELEKNWAAVVAAGVPNYFGPQRFGHGGANVSKGIDSLLNGTIVPRQLQSIYLSSVRSYLFNELLQQRVSENSWNKLTRNDFAQFTQGKGGFYCETPSDDDTNRCESGVISPCASLPGDSRDEFTALDERERQLLEPFNDVIAALKSKRVSRHFRKLRVLPEDAQMTVTDGDPVFEFFLPAGCFATSVLAELIFDPGIISSAVEWNE